MAGQLLTCEATAASQVGAIGLRVERSARLMSIMVDDLIGYTRTQLGAGMPTMLVDSDLRHICAAAVEDAVATHPGSQFDVALAGDLRGRFDPVRMHQLMTNLLINAAQYGDRAAPVLLRGHLDGDAVVIQVTNQGNAIPAASLQSIFRPLIQLPADGDERPSTSLGLGLFIAREIAVAHGGTIVVSSSEAQGTTFTVRLPHNDYHGNLHRN